MVAWLTCKDIVLPPVEIYLVVLYLQVEEPVEDDEKKMKVVEEQQNEYEQDSSDEEVRISSSFLFLQVFTGSLVDSPCSLLLLLLLLVLQDIRNTVGNIPMEWYKDFPHIGYNLDGKKIYKPIRSKDELDDFLDKMENPDYW